MSGVNFGEVTDLLAEEKILIDEPMCLDVGPNEKYISPLKGDNVTKAILGGAGFIPTESFIHKEGEEEPFVLYASDAKNMS